MGKYKKYSYWVKAAISMTGCPELFPELKIPRTTANDWIKQKYYSDEPVLESLIGSIERRRIELEGCKAQLTQQRALVQLLRSVIEILGFHFLSLKSCPSLKKHVNFWFGEHNQKIPHTSFSGETPHERFNRSWNKQNELRIFVGQCEALKLRVLENQNLACETCRAGFLC